MYIQLMWRHNSVQYPVKSTHILCNYYDVVRGQDSINETVLLKYIPVGWLPAQPSEILLTVVNERGSLGQRNLKYFRSWARLFDCYILELWNSTPH